MTYHPIVQVSDFTGKDHRLSSKNIYRSRNLQESRHHFMVTQTDTSIRMRWTVKMVELLPWMSDFCGRQINLYLFLFLRRYFWFSLEKETTKKDINIKMLNRNLCHHPNIYLVVSLSFLETIVFWVTLCQVARKQMPSFTSNWKLTKVKCCLGFLRP